MADQEHLNILNQGAAAWNNWRDANFYTRPQLRDIDFRAIDIEQNLSNAKLQETYLRVQTLLEPISTRQP